MSGSIPDAARQVPGWMYLGSVLLFLVPLFVAFALLAFAESSGAGWLFAGGMLWFALAIAAPLTYQTIVNHRYGWNWSGHRRRERSR